MDHTRSDQDVSVTDEREDRYTATEREDRPQEDEEFTHYAHLANGDVVKLREDDPSLREVAANEHVLLRDGKAHKVVGLYERERDTDTKVEQEKRK